VVGVVASYVWDSDYVLWPLLFAIGGCAVVFPLLVVRPLRAVLETLSHDADSGPED
jgi:hypothetical protein